MPSHACTCLSGSPLAPVPLQTLVCRRTLAGHTDDVLSLGGISVPVSQPDLALLQSPSSPIAGMLAGMSPLGLPLAAAPDSPMGAGAGSSPRAGAERALLFVSSSVDGTVRLWSGGWAGWCWCSIICWGLQPVAGLGLNPQPQSC
jgi:hypothetical protein